MEPSRRWMPSSVCVVAALVLILPLIAALPMTYAQEGKAKAARLAMGLINPYHDDVRAWISSAKTGQFSPWLAKSWELAPAGKSWRIQLQKGAPYHHGYGEFTAKDVIDNHALWGNDNDPGRKVSPTIVYRNVICTVERIEAVSNHELVMRCESPRLDVPLDYSEAVQNYSAFPRFYRSDSQLAHGQGPGLYRLGWRRYRARLADFSL